MGSLPARMFCPMGPWSGRIQIQIYRLTEGRNLESWGVTGGLLRGVGRIGDIKCCELGMEPALGDNLILIHAGDPILL